jgi:signal transduction histidine kinase
MPETYDTLAALSGLADRLFEHRAVVLQCVRRRVMRDPALPSAIAESRARFMDHLPELLAALEERLRTGGRETSRRRKPDAEPERAPGEKHGGHRSSQGYSLTETLEEWRHLEACLREEIERHAHDTPDFSLDAVLVATREFSDFIADGIAASAEGHMQQQRAEAKRRAVDLELALQQVRTLESERTRTWRGAIHDLRGNLGAVANASALLKRRGVAPETRNLSLEALERGLASLHDMLNDLTSLARLEAGQEQVTVSEFNAGTVLSELATTVRPLAMSRELHLETEGPEVLEVRGDLVKVQRIAQNLLLNAIRYTDRGSVRLSWGADAYAPGEHWTLTVQDDGPGLQGAQAERGGEGIGLSIVRQLCELLGARIAIDSRAGEGSRFIVTLPSRSHGK